MVTTTLYANSLPRAILPKALVKYFHLDVQIQDPADASNFAKLFPLKKIPAVAFSDGTSLTEAIAVSSYLVELSGDERAKKELLGGNAIERAQVLRWMSLISTDFMMPLTDAFLAIVGKIPYYEPHVQMNLEIVDQVADVYEKRLQSHDFLASDHLTLSDLLGASLFSLQCRLCSGQNGELNTLLLLNGSTE